VFGSKWLCGDIASGNLQEITDQVSTETNPDATKAPQPFRWQLDSGAVENFPVGARVGRFDCEFVTGVGKTSVSYSQTISGVASSTGAVGGKIRITVLNTATMHNGDAVTVAGVGGTTEANGTWPITVISSSVIELNGSNFQNAYISGGTLTTLTPLDPIE